MKYGRIRNNPYLDNFYTNHVFGPIFSGAPKKGVKVLNTLLIDKWSTKASNLRKFNDFIQAFDSDDNVDIILMASSKPSVERMLFLLNWLISDTNVGDIGSNLIKIYLYINYKENMDYLFERLLEERLNIEIVVVR